MGDETPADRSQACRGDDATEATEREGAQRPLGEFGDEEVEQQAEPAAGDAPLEHLVTGRFGDTTPDPPGEDAAPAPPDERRGERERGQ